MLSQLIRGDPYITVLVLRTIQQGLLKTLRIPDLSAKPHMGISQNEGYRLKVPKVRIRVFAVSILGAP